MTKADLRTGMFGLMNIPDHLYNPGEQLFVVVNDKLIYKSGGFDDIADLDDDLTFDGKYGHIDVLVEAVSFNRAEEYTHCDKHPNIIWKRDPKQEEDLDPELKDSFDEMAKTTKVIYQSYLDAGFTEEQAWELMKKSLEQAMTRNALQNLFGGLQK